LVKLLTIERTNVTLGQIAPQHLNWL